MVVLVGLVACALAVFLALMVEMATVGIWFVTQGIVAIPPMIVFLVPSGIVVGQAVASVTKNLLRF